MTNRRPGRPLGPKHDETAIVQRIMEMLKADTTLSRRQAIIAVVEDEDDATIRRLQRRISEIENGAPQAILGDYKPLGPVHASKMAKHSVDILGIM